MINTYYKGELGRVIYPTPLPFDITGYTITVYVTKPDATVLNETGSIVEATTGQISWTTGSGDLSLVGEYTQQVKAVNGGITRYGEIELFRVENTLA